MCITTAILAFVAISLMLIVSTVAKSKLPCSVQIRQVVLIPISTVVTVCVSIRALPIIVDLVAIIVNT
jgi:hypothetical protein